MRSRTSIEEQGRDEGLVQFVIIAFAITWVLQLPVVLHDREITTLPGVAILGLMFLAAFGPAVAALIAARRSKTAGGVPALLRQAGRWRVGVVWYAIALLLPTLVHLAAAALTLAFGGGAPSSWIVPPASAQAIGAIIVPALGEEIGWRGFAQERLQRRTSALRASLIVGLVWGLWHLPTAFMAGGSATGFALHLAMILAGSIVITWLYNSSGQSLLIAMLAHAGMNLRIIGRAPASAGVPIPVLTEVLLWCLVAALVVSYAGPAHLARRRASEA